MKQKFKIGCSWTMIGELEIEAENLKEAKEIAEDSLDLPEKSEYLDSSFQVNIIQDSKDNLVFEN
jgi:catechol-2,3-dioxygenase